jgi:hypothetical protein
MSHVYELRVKGYVDRKWATWLDGFTVVNLESGDATLTGSVVAQVALHGILLKGRDLGLPHLCVYREGLGQARLE